MENKRVLLDFSSDNDGPIATEFESLEELTVVEPVVTPPVTEETNLDSEDETDDTELEDGTGVEDADENESESDQDVIDEEEESNDSVEDGPEESYQAFGDAIKAVGLLPADLELPEDVTGGDILEKVRDHLVPQYKQEALTEVQGWLTNQGITQQHLVQLKALATGAPDKLVTDLTTYHSIGSIPKTDLDEMDEDRKEELIRFMFNDQGVDKIAVDATISTHKDNLDPLVEKVIAFASEKYTSIEKAERDRQQQVDTARAEKEAYRNSYIQNVFTESKLGEYTLDDQDLALIRNSLFNRNKQLNINGNRQIVTSYEEFKYRIDNDIQFQLQVFFESVNRDKILNKVRASTAKEVETDFLKKIPSKAISKKRVSTKKKKRISSKAPNSVYSNYNAEEISNSY